MESKPELETIKEAEMEPCDDAKFLENLTAIGRQLLKEQEEKNDKK